MLTSVLRHLENMSCCGEPLPRSGLACKSTSLEVRLSGCPGVALNAQSHVIRHSEIVPLCFLLVGLGAQECCTTLFASGVWWSATSLLTCSLWLASVAHPKAGSPLISHLSRRYERPRRRTDAVRTQRSQGAHFTRVIAMTCDLISSSGKALT